MEGCRHSDAVEVFILFPDGRVSEVQRRQMTTLADPSLHAVAVEGDFDDCQRLVKAAFADEAFRTEVNLGAVNSINWARVMAQIVYYVTSHLSLIHISMELMGIHVHIGSQVFSAENFADALAMLGPIVGEWDLPEFVVGGGLGVPYVTGEEAPTITQWANGIHRACDEAGIRATVSAEPGR